MEADLDKGAGEFCYVFGNDVEDSGFFDSLAAGVPDPGCGAMKQVWAFVLLKVRRGA